MFINRAGGMVLPFMTIYATQQLHFSITKAGLIITAFGAGAIAGGITGGFAIAKIGFYKVQLISLLTSGVFFIILSFQQSFIGVILTVILLSFFSESYRPANSTAIGYYSTPENRVRSFSLNRLAINLGWALGGGLGGFLAVINYHLLFWVDGSSSLLAGILLFKTFSSDRPVMLIKNDIEPVKQHSPYKDPVYMLFIFFCILVCSCFFLFLTCRPFF
ncbi:MFS transporter [Mucilaginibacter antarcticus]|uniref:MFS transporter n=1 Tax=Mucilaginibacter antarcticus TaxID=1855725 RepID=UPI003635A6F9